MNSLYQIDTLITCLIAIVLLNGCGGKDPRSRDLVPASGSVVYNGKPVEGATVVFFNEDEPSKPGGSAVTASDGKFKISLYGDGDGTYPGNYVVTVSKIEVTSKLTDEQLLDYELQYKEIPADNTKTVSLLPEKYATKAATSIRLTIPSKGDKDIKIELTDK
ncbi:MAG: carboxypeptidase-like regulatory domain-containing protein [Planctomycetaceae bacterium]|nr:carboxypeptidase-like regulatory domain-containing protein [Planctomycetaceae bacterium]